MLIINKLINFYSYLLDNKSLFLKEWKKIKDDWNVNGKKTTLTKASPIVHYFNPKLGWHKNSIKNYDILKDKLYHIDQTIIKKIVDKIPYEKFLLTPYWEAIAIKKKVWQKIVVKFAIMMVNYIFIIDAIKKKALNFGMIMI